MGWDLRLSGEELAALVKIFLPRVTREPVAFFGGTRFGLDIFLGGGLGFLD